MKTTASALVVSLSVLGGALLTGPAAAQDDASRTTALEDIEETLGFVPTFLQQMPAAGFAGAWQQLKDLEFSEDTALDAKTKALVGLAVVSQIPCHYCIWADTESARAAGATEEEIREAVAIAATERYWSTMLNGLQVDFETFKQEFGSLSGTEAAAR
jgi:AhpD family alkylhydroperoxidase